MDPENISKKQEVLTAAKTQINELLYQVLPGGCTLDEMETLAVEIYASVVQSWEEHS